MDFLTDNWNIIPQEETGNKKVIYFSISDSYVFAAATLLVSLHKNAPKVADEVDVLVYNDGISEKNKQLLRSLHENIFFMQMQFPTEWEEIFAHPRTIKWGHYIICKPFGYELIKKYETALFLDVDMVIQGDISELFEMEEEIAWRNIIGWNIHDNFAPILKPDETISCGNAGLYVFSNKLLKYNVDKQTILSAFKDTKDLVTGGVDENIIAWITHKKQAVLKELDIGLYNTPPLYVNDETKLIHFLNARKVSGKPWENLAAYLFFDNWAGCYQKWLELGGEGPVHYTKDDYFKLFAYDKALEIIKLKKKVASHTTEKIESLKAELAKEKKRAKKAEETANTIRNSTSWKITKPLRAFAKLFKK